MSISILLLFAGTLLAFSISAVSGGGAGLLLLPLLGTLLPGAQVPAALSVGTASSSLSRILAFRSQICWDIVLWFVPAALPAVWLGAKLLSYVNPLYLELLMGLFLVGNLPLLFRPTAELSTTHVFPKGFLILIGFAAGFVSGLTGAVGLLFNRFYLRYGLHKEQIVATRAANELLLHLVKLGLYASFGLLTSKALTFGGIVATAAVIASWGMKRLLPRLSETLFRRVGYAAMVVAGGSILIGASSRLMMLNGMQISLSPFSRGLETRVQWRQRALFALELEYDEGFEYERRITLPELPSRQQARVRELIRGTDHYLLEEVFGFNSHSYEVYLFRQGKVEKVDLQG